jgi:hypothetical protein
VDEPLPPERSVPDLDDKAGLAVPPSSWQFGMMTADGIDASATLAAVREYLLDPPWGPRWVAGRVVSATVILVLCRFPEGEHVVGVFVDLSELADDPYEEGPLYARALGEIVEPSPAAYVDGADWADGLIDDTENVLWRHFPREGLEGRVRPFVQTWDVSPVEAEWFIGYGNGRTDKK